MADDDRGEATAFDGAGKAFRVVGVFAESLVGVFFGEDFDSVEEDVFSEDMRAREFWDFGKIYLANFYCLLFSFCIFKKITFKDNKFSFLHNCFVLFHQKPHKNPFLKCQSFVFYKIYKQNRN